MKKVKAFVIALILLLISAIAMESFYSHKIKNNGKSYIYDNQDKRNGNTIAMGEVLKHGIPVFGSSELSSDDRVGFPPHLFKGGNSDFNMILIGRGNIQSLLHTISLGGLEKKIEKRKVVFILSPQWFEHKYTVQAFPSRFNERMYVEFLKNEKVSQNTKKMVSKRAMELMETDKKAQEKLKFLNEVLLNKTSNPIKKFQYFIYDKFMTVKSNFMYGSNLKNRTNKDSMLKAETIDYKALMAEAEKVGKSSSTNNDLSIYNNYYDTYIKSKYVSGESKGTSSKGNMRPERNGTKEYDDFQLFLDVCKEVNIEPLIVNIPVHGKWYDWTGFSKEEREHYYKKIREICSINNVKLTDFSDKEYEKYFLKDIMHLGWKGWVYLDDAVYKFHKK